MIRFVSWDWHDGSRMREIMDAVTAVARTPVYWTSVTAGYDSTRSLNYVYAVSDQPLTPEAANAEYLQEGQP